MSKLASLAVCALLAFQSVLAQDALLTAEQVLQNIKARRGGIGNATFKVKWETLTDGTLDTWERQTLYWDSLGRRRLIYEHGTLDSSGVPVPTDDPTEMDVLFNGEILLDKSFHAKRDRRGKSSKDGGEGGGYRAAIIGDAHSPIRSDLESHRNPLEYIENVAVRDLEDAVKVGGAVVARTEGGDYEIAYDEPRDSPVPFRRSVVHVDPRRGWLVTQLESFSEDGRLVREIAYDYEGQDDGNWVPVKGSHRHWGNRSQDEHPIFEWRFQAEYALLNDPEFDEHVFDIVLEPDTAVSDTRYDVAYRIGPERAVADDLARLAQEARTGPAPIAIPAASPLRRWWLLAINGVLILIILLVGFLRRAR